MTFGVGIAAQMEDVQRKCTTITRKMTLRATFPDDLFLVIRYSGYNGQVIRWANNINERRKTI